MPLLARPRFFSCGCTVCLFIFFSSHSGLNRLDFFIFSFRRADGFSRAEKFFCFALPLLFRKCPDACSRPKLFLDFGTLAHIVEFFFKNKSGAKKKTAMWRSFLGNLMLLLFFYIVLKEQVEEYEQGAGNCGFNPEYCRPICDCFCASLRGKGRVAVD